MNYQKKIEILESQIEKLQSEDFNHHNWFIETGNLLKLIFEDAEDRKQQLKSAMHKPAYAFTGIKIENLIKDWSGMLTGYISEIKLLSDEVPDSETSVNDEFIDESRIQELENLESDDFDLTKLITLCNELNWNYSNSNFLTVSMLCRAIIDHIPPIFNVNTFNEVANNYGSKSFKRNMLNLNNSLRNIADSYLHQTIRKKETLPNKTQIDFKNDLDVLLAEIIRFLS